MKHHALRLALVLLLASMVGLPASLMATQVLSSTEETMSIRSHMIVLGRVASVESRWDLSRPLIVTDVEVEAEQFLKGENMLFSSRVKVTFDGGQVGEDRCEMHGMPEFTKGEEVLLFLKLNPDGQSFHVFAISYGKYRVGPSDKAGKRLVDGPSFHQEQHYDLDTGRPVKTDRRSEIVYLEDFLLEITGYLKSE